MDENKMENIQASMKYYCRVCTTNTRNKRSKPDECIGIFKKAGLKSILEKYLHLQISEDDPLPKVICKVCFEKIEAIEFLRVIARRTETLLKDFLRNKEYQAKSHTQFQNAYNSFAISQTTPREPPQKDDEVVVNVSLSDPLTKDINKKLLVAQRKKESLDKAFTPTQISRSAVTSSPNIPPPPVTIVHQMPRKKLPTVPNLVEKRKKTLQMALTNATTVTLENPPPTPVASPIKLPTRPKLAPPPPLRHISEAPAIPQKVEIHPVISANTHTLGHGVSLGSIIKDEDLLRLILKALRWPVNNQTLNIQIQRLKNTNFSDIIVDPNLLQDTDLIQILGPLIHPTLVPMSVVPQQQAYQINIPPEQLTIPPATISYKLPAETSVQIITVPPEEKVTPPMLLQRPSTSNVRSVARKRQRYAPTTPKAISNNVIVVSDDSDDELMKPLTAIEDVEVQLDPAMYPGVGENSNSNEAMLATLNRQREAMMRMHRIKRKQSLMPSNVEMVDDIMIVDEGIQMNESYPEVVLVKKPRKAQMMPPQASTSQVKPLPTVHAGIPTVKSMTSVAPVSEPPKKLLVQPPPPPPPAPTPAPSPKLPTLPIKKLPTLLGALKKTTESPALNKVQIKKDALIPRKTLPVQHNYSTTLADADSTTKFVIKESKVPKPQTSASEDIEEQIIKVRIGKQTQKSSTPKEDGDANKKRESSSDEEVVIVVEYEETDEEGAKESEKKDDCDEVSAAEVREEDIVASPEDIEEDDVVEVSPSEVAKESNEFEMPSIEIKEEKEQEAIESKEVKESPIKEEKLTKSDDKKESTTEAKPALRSFVASKTSPVADPTRLTRSTQKRKVQPKKEEAKPLVTKSETYRKSSSNSRRSSCSSKESKSSSTSHASSSNKEEVTTFRPARRSKTLSKYYKGPPAAGPAGRSMRSRT